MIANAPLVGRQDVLAYLGGVLARARNGAGGLVLLTGEPGIGKTRVAEELVQLADGFSVHWSWCTSEHASASLRPWAQLIRALSGSNTEVAEQVARSEHLRGLLAGTPGQQGDPELNRSLLSNDLTQVLSLAAQSTPLLLVLDDLHDAQLSTLRVLADLTAVVRTCPIVVVATARDAAHEWQGREQVRGELLGQAHRLSLSPLDASAVAELLPDADPARTQELLERTGGNALLLTEMARATEGVPASLRAMVAARTARLSPESRRLVEAASVLGARFRLDVLAEVAALPLQEVSRNLVDLVTLDGPGRARFTHELLRDAVYASLSASDQLTWHDRAGAVLSQLHERGRDVAAAEVATHLLRAGADGAAAAALEAARRAAGMSAFEDAVRWYDQVLPLLDDPTERTHVLLELARARRGCGDRDGARAVRLRAADLAPTPELHATAVLALGTGAGGFEVDSRDGEQIAQLEKALAALPPDALALRASVLARLSVARWTVTPQSESLAVAEEAVALARSSGDALALAGALAALCDALAGPDHLSERTAFATEILELAGPDAEIELLGRRLRLVAFLEAGDRRAAEQEAAAYELRAQAVRHPQYLWYPPLWRGQWALAEGRFDDVRTYLDETARSGAGSENCLMLTMTQRWWLLATTADRAALEEFFDATDPDLFQGTWATIAFSLSLVQRGRLDEARELFDSVANLVLDLHRDSEWLSTSAQVCEIVHALDHPLAPLLYEALLPHADVFVIEGIGAAIRGPVHRYLALIAPTPALAALHRASSDEACRRMGVTALLSAPGTSASGPVWKLEGETWTVCFGGPVSRVRDSKGMRDLATLLAAQGHEVGALDLIGAEAVLEHDTGEVLDGTARDAYKARLRDLEALDSLSQAEASERAFLLAQLSSAYGLGGRARRTGSSAERARSTVTARLRDTIKRVTDLDPLLGKHLAHAVRTGTFCSYRPETPVVWDLTP